MKILELEQGSTEWFQARVGRATASKFSAILAKGQGKTRAAYLRQIAAERLTGKPTESYSNDHMERGKEQEAFARAEYETAKGVLVDQVCLVLHDSLMVACSPDGLIGLDGGQEIKSVIPTVQMDTILAGGYPSEHRAQIQGCMWVTERKWWDFTSYSPDLPEPYRLYVFRVVRDEDYIMTLNAEVTAFLAEVDEFLSRLRNRAA